MKSRLFLAISLTFGFLGCTDQGTSLVETQSPTRFPPSYSFDYKAFDEQGSMSASGTLTLLIDNSHVTGSWRFDDGRQGALAGSSNDNTIQIDLYPGYQDHNLILTGKLSAGTFSGDWVLYGWSILGRGSFIAKVRLVVFVD